MLPTATQAAGNEIANFLVGPRSCESVRQALLDGGSTRRVHGKYGSTLFAAWAESIGIPTPSLRARIERDIGLGGPPIRYVSTDGEAWLAVASTPRAIGYSFTGYGVRGADWCG